MRRFLSNNLTMLAAAIVLAAIGVVVSIMARDFSWFARSGALITGIAMIVLTRPSITGTDIKIPVLMELGLTQLDPEYYHRRSEPIPDWLVEDRKSRKAVGVLGPALTLGGILIWGFADLLNGPFGFQHWHE